MSQRIAVEVPMALPTPNLREHEMVRAKRVREQRQATRQALERMAKPPSSPRVVVTLTRISTQLADTDRSDLSLAAIRDEVARWVCGIPFEELDVDKQGRPKLDGRGRPKMRAPRAPDGPNDPLVWRYGQQRTTLRVAATDKRGRPLLDKRGRPRQRGFQAVRIEIDSIIEECAEDLRREGAEKGPTR